MCMTVLASSLEAIDYMTLEDLLEVADEYEFNHLVRGLTDVEQIRAIVRRQAQQQQSTAYEDNW